MTSDKRLRALYRAMSAEAKGPATMNYILALKSKVDELQMELDFVRAVQKHKEGASE